MTLSELQAGEDSIKSVRFTPPKPRIRFDFDAWPAFCGYSAPELTIEYLSGRSQTFVGAQALEMLRWAQAWGAWRQSRTLLEEQPTWCEWLQWRPRRAREPVLPVELF